MGTNRSWWLSCPIVVLVIAVVALTGGFSQTVILEKNVYNISDRIIYPDAVITTHVATGRALNNDAFSEGLNLVDNQLYMISEDTELIQSKQLRWPWEPRVVVYDTFREAEVRYYDSSLPYCWYRDNWGRTYDVAKHEVVLHDGVWVVK